jgi:cytochrome P450
MSNPVSFSYQDVARRKEQQVQVPLTVDIYRWYQAMQQSHSVFFDSRRVSWLILRYEEVQRVLLDHQTFSSQFAVGPDGNVDPIMSPGMLGTDPPRHRQLRALVSQAFTPRVVANLEPRITSIVQTLLDQVADRGEMDLVDALAFPLPVRIITELLGIPGNDHEFFRIWSADFMGSDAAQRLVAAQHIVQYLRTLITQRLQEPQEDLISALLQVEIDGERLPEDELLGTCLLLLVAGHETTTGLISNALVCLDEHPESLQELIAQPDLLPSAIEEVLRYRSVVHTDQRVALVDTVLDGQQIKAGDLVLPCFASANLDEQQFPNANTFNIRRTPNRHLGFGYGIHFCLGASLARLEARIALQILLTRFPTIRCKRTSPLELRPSPTIYGLKHVFVEW